MLRRGEGIGVDGRLRPGRPSGHAISVDAPDDCPVDGAAARDLRMGGSSSGEKMQALDRLLARLARFNDAACAVGKWGSLTLIGLMTAAILLQVFFRYVLGGALTWTEEVGRYMMVWMTFLVAPIAYRTGANVALEVLAAHIHGRLAEALKIVLNLLVITFIVVFFYESLGLIGRGFKIKAATFPVQMAWIFMILPASFVVMFTVAIELIGRGVQRLVDPSRPPEPPPPGLLAVD